MKNLKSQSNELTLHKHKDSSTRQSYPIINDFTIIEDVLVTRKSCMNSVAHPGSMSIIIVKNESEKTKPYQIQIHKNNNSKHNIHNETPTVEQELLISGVCFTSNFIENMGLPHLLSPYSSRPFSSTFSQIWELEPEQTISVKKQLQLLGEYVKNITTHPFGEEIFVNAFSIFLYEVEAARRKHFNLNIEKHPTSRQEIHVHKFQSLVQQQFRKTRQIKDYAAQLNVSAKYLTEIVKQTTGRNASELINLKVIREAKLLLKAPEVSIGEIADQLHFSDQSHFGKYFKKQTGTSPKTFREKNLHFLNKTTLREGARKFYINNAAN